MSDETRDLTKTVIARLAATDDPRFVRVMTQLIQHLHDFVRASELTEAEWLAGIRFLTAVGQKCDAERQETILLSDTLGVSMLVDAINHHTDGATESTVLGPFFRESAPPMPLWTNIAPETTGAPTYLSGRVLDLQGKPIAGAELEVWQTDADGFYDVQRPERSEPYARARFQADADGFYAFRTVKPVSYRVPTDGPVGDMLRRMQREAFRPAHVHFMLRAPGFRTLATHLFVRGNEHLESDAVFAVKESLIVDFEEHPAGTAPDGNHSDVPFYVVRFDFRLAPANA